MQRATRDRTFSYDGCVDWVFGPGSRTAVAQSYIQSHCATKEARATVVTTESWGKSVLSFHRLHGISPHGGWMGSGGYAIDAIERVHCKRWVFV
jgi:hypothetical protein